MEKILVQELKKIDEFKNNTFPLNAPEGDIKEYLVYILTNYKEDRDLQGINGSIEASYILNVMCKSYARMKILTRKVKDIVLKLTDIKDIEDVNIVNIAETYEENKKVYRGIIDLDIKYKNESEVM